MSTEEATSSVISFLKTNVPTSSIANIASELKKEFVLAKKKSKLKKQKSKKKRNYLNRNEKKNLSFYNLPRGSLKHVDFLPMNLIWNRYINEVLQLNSQEPNMESKGWDSFTQALYKADFHGSILKVIRSKCPSYVDKIGICVLDTRNTFKILSTDNKVTTIPKKDCVFELHINNTRLTLFGKQLCVRPAERSSKKVKTQHHPDL